jgi:hypothetical protein
MNQYGYPVTDNQGIIHHREENVFGDPSMIHCRASFDEMKEDVGIVLDRSWSRHSSMQIPVLYHFQRGSADNGPMLYMPVVNNNSLAGSFAIPQIRSHEPSFALAATHVSNGSFSSNLFQSRGNSVSSKIRSKHGSFSENNPHMIAVENPQVYYEQNSGMPQMIDQANIPQMYIIDPTIYHEQNSGMPQLEQVNIHQMVYTENPQVYYDQTSGIIHGNHANMEYYGASTAPSQYNYKLAGNAVKENEIMHAAEEHYHENDGQTMAKEENYQDNDLSNTFSNVNSNGDFQWEKFVPDPERRAAILRWKNKKAEMINKPIKPNQYQVRIDVANRRARYKGRFLPATV